MALTCPSSSTGTGQVRTSHALSPDRIRSTSQPGSLTYPEDITSNLNKRSPDRGTKDIHASGLNQTDPMLLQCPFEFIQCFHTFTSVHQWDAHCRSHFYDRLPKTVHCPFLDCHWFITAGTGNEAWDERWDHIQTHFHAGHKVDVTKRPDQVLIEHLWRTGVIGNAQKKELKATGRLGDFIFTQSADPRRDIREQKRRSRDFTPASSVDMSETHASTIA